MFCPKCKAEYREGITECFECGCSLCDTLPQEDSAFDPDDNGTCVYIASDEFEAEIIIAKLRAEGIYAFKRFRGTDGYGRIVLGRTVLGVEVIVASSDAITAVEIINS